MPSIQTLSVALLLGASALATPIAVLDGATSALTGATGTEGIDVNALDSMTGGGAGAGAGSGAGSGAGAGAGGAGGAGAGSGAGAGAGAGNGVVTGNNGQYGNGNDGEYGVDGQYGQYWNGLGWQYNDCDRCEYHDRNDYDWRHGKQCYSREETYRHRESIGRGDYSDCPDEFKEEEWSKFVEECYSNYDNDECDECDDHHDDHHDDCDECEDYDWRHGEECYTREETYRYRESISRGDYSECPEYFKEEEWTRFVEECYEQCEDYDKRDYDECDECDNDNDYDWRHGKECYTREESERHVESIRRNDYSNCPSEFKHEEWKKFVEECYYTQHDDEEDCDY